MASNRAAGKGADAQAKGSNATIAEQRRQYDQTRKDQLPFLEAGYGALDRQNKFLSGDFSGFNESPDYAYAQQQMTQGLDRGAAARGRLYSGGYGVDMASHLNGLASQNANNYWSKLAGMAGQGYNAAANLGQAGQNSANQIGNAYANAGNARASAFAAQGNAWSNAANTAGQAYMYNRGQRSQPVASSPTAFGNNWGTYGSGWGS